jgi:secondary thiamine-phosphate synthase enzyme
MPEETVRGFVQHAAEIGLKTKGEVEIRDITALVRKVVRESGVATGQCLVFTTSSTSAVTTLEHEPGLLRDLPEALERLFPRHGEGVDYGHEEAWQDGNGHSHVRAAILKPDLVIPVQAKEIVVGTWQQVVFVELDNKPRERRLVVHVWGTA